MDRGRTAAALLALAACIACSAAAPHSTSSDQTALEVSEGPSSGCYYNFQHYGEGDRIMTNEPCLNCTCHNRMLMCYLRVCPFTKPIGQDCTIEKRADQCCPIVTCPDVPVDLLTSTSTSSPAEYGATGLGKLDKYGCSINGKYFPEGSKVPPSPNKPCEHCYCIRNMTTCVMQECTLHVDGCTPIYHKDVCCPVRYSCDHPEDEIPLLDDMTTTIRPTPGFLLTTTTIMPVTQPSQNCVHDDQIVPDGALIKTEKACEHCYCMKGDIVCVVQECGTPMENEGKNCTSLPPRQGQCCPDTYICEGDEISTEETTEMQELTTTPPRRFSVEGSGYRLEPDETYTETPSFVTDEEGSGEEHLSTVPVTEKSFEKPTQTKETLTPHDTIYDISTESVQMTNIPEVEDFEKHEDKITTELISTINTEEQVTTSSKEYATNVKEDDHMTTSAFVTLSEEIVTTETPTLHDVVTTKVEKTTRVEDILDEATLKEDDLVPEKEHKVPVDNEYVSTTPATVQDTKTTLSQESTTLLSVEKLHTEEIVTPEIETQTLIDDIESDTYTTTPKEKFDVLDTTSINPVENEIQESDVHIYSPGRIPGEGDCLLNSITYQNNSSVPSSNNCHSSCRCISSIIKCDPIVCSAPPEYMSDCQPIYDSPESCCPTYVCSTKETIPPESHNQMSESESVKPILASECNSPDCESLAPSDCSNNDCVPKDKVSSQDTADSCDGEKCKVDLSLEKHPELHRDAPVECSPENGCNKPLDTQSGNDCSDGNCKLEPALECTGSDCGHEIIKDTTPAALITTSHEYPALELTEKSDTTDKIEIIHDAEKEIETSTQGLHIETIPVEEHITEAIKSSTEIPQTESSQSQDTTFSHEITETPAHGTTLSNNLYTEHSAVSETESDLNKQQQSTEPIEQGVTIESDVIHKDVYEATMDRTTSRITEQAITDTETVTEGAYETKPVEPVTQEIGVTYSPEPTKETIIPTDDQANEINVDITKHHTDSIQETTESVLKETTTAKQTEVPQEDTSMFDISGSTISDTTITEKIESSTNSYPAATESDHKEITKLFEHDTETQNSLGYEDKDKVTESVSVITESDIKITDVTESSEYKPISDNTGTEMTDEIYTELPITEVTKLIEPKLDTTSIPKVTEKSDQDRATERIQEQTEISVDEHKEVTTESVTTDSKFIYEKQTEISVDEHKEVTTESVTTDSKFIYEKQTELSVDEHKEVTTESVPTDSIFIYDKQTTEAQLDSVTSAVLRDKESENTMTEAIPTENIIEGDVTVTVSSEGVQEIHTSIPEIKTTETSTESGYHYEPSSPVFDEKVETTALPVNEVPIKITTESEQDVTSGTIAPEITEKEKQEKELTTTRPHGHDYYTTEESYQASSQTSIDKDLSEKPDITTVSPIHVEEIVTTQNQEEFTSTVKDAISSKVDVQQVAAEVSTVSYHEATTNIVSLTETVLPTDSYDTVNPPVDTQPETDANLQTTEASIKYEDTQTTESEIKVNVGFDDKLSTTTESNVYNVEPQTEKIESDIPTKEVTYTEEASTSIPSDEITDKPTKEIEEHEKITEISEIVTVVPEKTEITTTRIIEMDSDTKTPETYTTSSQDVVSDVSTIVPVTSEYGTKEFETETPYIPTTSKAIDVIVEMTTVKEVKEETGAEQHSETGSGEEDTATSSPTTTSEVQDFDLNHEISTIEILTSSSSTEKPTKDTSPTKEEQIETTPATIELTTQSNIEIQKETSLSSGIESATAAIDTHNASTEIMSTTQEPEGLEPELVTEKTIKDNTEPLPERNDQQGEPPLEASTPYSTQEEISTPHSALSLVTDDSEKEHIEPQTDVASTIPEQEKHTLTTEPLLIEQGLTTTDRFTTKEPEILTTFQQEPAEHDVQTTSSDEKISNTDINKYPEIITEYPEKTTADQTTNKDNKIPYPPITEVSQTILPETTVSESQSVTKEATLSQNLYDTTTQKLLEEVTEKEAGLEETTKLPMHYGDKYETTTTLLLETEPERQTNKPTKEELPDTGDYGTTLAEEVDSEKDSDVTKSPSIYTTKQTTEQQTRDQTENVADTSTHIDISHDATTSISPNTISDNEMESQASTEQSIPSKDHYDITTTVPIEKVTEKESEMEISTTSGVSSVPIEEQTEKEILREPSKDKLETTTFVTIEKDLTTPATQDKHPVIEDTSVTKETSDISSYERTTLKSLDEVTEYPSIIKQTVQEDLYQPTISRLPEKDTEKEVDSDIKLVATTLDTSFTTLGASSSTPTNKLPESTDDAQKSTEPAMEYSETTPYLIELQEHTHQSIDELSSKTPIDGESTTEQYISEHPDRGDIPHDVNVKPTSLHEDMDVTTPKEDKSSTTPKYINDEIPTETDQTTAQSPSESPKEEDKYTVLPIETEKPLSTPEIEAHTDKHIPGDYESHKPVTDIVTSTEEVSKVTMPPVFTKPSEESTIHTEEDKPEEKPVESTEVFKPDLNEPSDDLPSPDFPPSGAGGYGQEPDYGDNEDQAFGPGTCRYGGKVYVSAQQIPRDDPCDFCFCFRSDIICLQQSCPPPIHGCHEEPIQGFCCPRYECPVSMATTLNVTTTTTTTTTTLPPHFLPHAYKGAAQRRGCQIKGHTYKVGEVVRASSGPCLHCTCGGDGQMKCDPKACTPEPMLRQMIAAAVSAKRRR